MSNNYIGRSSIPNFSVIIPQIYHPRSSFHPILYFLDFCIVFILKFWWEFLNFQPNHLRFHCSLISFCKFFLV
eukprot:UN01806